MDKENCRKRFRLEFIGGKYPFHLPSKLHGIEVGGINDDIPIYNLLNCIDFDREKVEVQQLSKKVLFSKRLIEVKKATLRCQKELLLKHCEHKLINAGMESPKHTIKNMLDKTKDPNDTSLSI